MRKLLSYVFLIISVVFLSYYVSENWISLGEMYFQLNSLDLVLLTVLLIVIFVISGIRMSFINKVISGKQISWSHQAILPLAMSYAGYAIPIKGGMVYQSFFFKKFYAINHFYGVSTGVISQIIPLQVIGVIGIAMSYFLGSSNLLSLLFLGITFLSVSFFVWIRLFLIFSTVRESRVGILLKDLDEKLKLRDMLPGIYFISIVKIICEFLWFFLAFNALNFDATVELSIVFVMVRNCLIILKITPGNIGINEFVGGLSSELLFDSADYGLVVMLLIRAISMFITFTLGAFYFYKYRIY